MTPVFVSRNVFDTGYVQCVGSDNDHLKLNLSNEDCKYPLSAIAFRQSVHFDGIVNSQTFDVCYSLEENTYRGKTSIQLKVRDIKTEKVTVNS